MNLYNLKLVQYSVNLSRKENGRERERGEREIERERERERKCDKLSLVKLY